MFKRCVTRLLMPLVLAVAAPAAMAAPADASVPYPQGWRQWTHVKAMVISQGHPLFDSFGGIHHLYANRKAEQGYRSGQFGDGSIIAFDLLEVRQVDHTLQEGPRKVLGVMHKDSRKYAATGGWGFEAFKGDSTTERAVGANAASACYQCHTAQKDKGHVFSSLRP